MQFGAARQLPRKFFRSHGFDVTAPVLPASLKSARTELNREVNLRKYYLDFKSLRN
jgi:hypothetical protein